MHTSEIYSLFCVIFLREKIRKQNYSVTNLERWKDFQIQNQKQFPQVKSILRANKHFKAKKLQINTRHIYTYIYQREWDGKTHETWFGSADAARRTRRWVCVCVCVCEMKTKQEEEAANKNKTNNNRVGKRAHRNGEAFFVAKKYETKNSFFAKQHTERRGSLLCCEGHCYFIFY